MLQYTEAAGTTVLALKLLLDVFFQRLWTCHWAGIDGYRMGAPLKPGDARAKRSKSPFFPSPPLILLCFSSIKTIKTNLSVRYQQRLQNPNDNLSTNTHACGFLCLESFQAIYHAFSQCFNLIHTPTVFKLPKVQPTSHMLPLYRT